MAYLIFADYKKQVQTDNLLQVIGNDLTVLKTAELQAIEEAYGYLSQKYDTSKEFTNTQQYSQSAAYYAGDRIYLDATAYSATSTYSLNDLCLYNGVVYVCVTAITVAEAFNVNKWIALGNQYDIFNAQYPKPLFNYKSAYKIGDQVFWGNRIYTAKRASSSYGDDIEFRLYENIPIQNIFPDDPINGVTYWGAGTAYSVTNTLPIITTAWAAADNRTQSILMVVIDVTLFHVHSRISPRNIPDLRKDRYSNAIQMLQAFARGEMTAKLPVLQPKQGVRIRYGGAIKNQNSY